MDISHFHNLHVGETGLLVGNGENLKKTPPDKFSIPSIGMNTIHLYEGWRPTYYTAVDSRVFREFGEAITERYSDIPKFIPTPNLDRWQGENFYRFYHRPGPLWPLSQQSLWPSGLLTERGITYANVMHIAIQIAFYMGFTTLLIIGMEHRPMKAQAHFWGCDHGMQGNPDIADWLSGYKELTDGMKVQGVQVLNISQDTYVPDEIIPRADWRQYANS